MQLADVQDAPELWRLLVTGTSAPELAPAVAVEAFRRLHGAGQPRPVDSALLLCTDWRWRRTSARVLAGVLDSGVLDDAQQDWLAQEFLWQDQVQYAHPLGWIGDTFVEVDLDPVSRRRAAWPREVRIDPSTRVTTERHVWPPLRSRSATLILVRRHAEPTDVLARARALPPRDGAAVVTGAVHAADELDPDEASRIVDVALRWANKAPRWTALRHLAARGEGGRARAIAAGDPDASIRAWSRTVHTDTVSEPILFG